MVVTVEGGTGARAKEDTVEEGEKVVAFAFFLFRNAGAGDFDFFENPLAEIKQNTKEKESQHK